MKPLVTDAGDRVQVREAERKEALRLSQHIKDLQAVLETPQGRRVFWRLLENTRVFETIWENSARIHYNAGRQDVGHAVMADIVTAGEQFLLLMMTENGKDK